MAIEIIFKLVFLGIDFFFYISINIIVPGVGVNGNTFLSRDILAK